MTISRITSGRFLRPLCYGVAILTFISASPMAFASGLEFLVKETSRQVTLRTAPEFSEAPRAVPPHRGLRDEARSGWFTPRLRADLDRARLNWSMDNAMSRGEMMVNSLPGLASLVIESGGNGGGGGGEAPGEGGGNGGGSNQGSGGSGGGGMTGFGLQGETNTNTGNNLLSLHVVAYESRGDSGVDFTLFYNSRDTWNDVFGKKWTHSYDARISHTPGSSAQVRMPDGLIAPYAENAGVFIRPVGWNHRLVRNSNNTWTKTFHDQSVWEFNTAGLLTAKKDRWGNTTTVGRDSNGRVTTVSAADGRAVTLEYNSDGRVWRITDPASRQWTFNYDGNARLTGVAFPVVNGQTPTRQFTYNTSDLLISEQDLRTYLWEWTYDSSGRLLTHKNPRGHSITYSYSANATTITLPGGQSEIHSYTNGLLTQVQDAAGFTTHFTYNTNRDVITEKDQRNFNTTATYDANGNILTITNALGQTNTYTYNTANDPLTIKNHLNEATTLTYDGFGRLQKVVDPLGRDSVTVAYDAFGQPITSTDALGRVQTIEYSTRGEVTKVTDPAGVQSTVGYDILSRPTWVRDADLNQTSFAYDNLGRRVTVTHPGGAVETTTHDLEGLVIGVEDALGNDTLFAYDAAKNPTQHIDAAGAAEFRTYNSNNWLTAATNFNGHTRVYEHTSRGEIKKLTLPDGAIEQWTYAPTGETAMYTSPLGYQVTTVLDNLGRTSQIDYPTGTPDVSFAYDSAGRKTSMVDGTGTSSWTYNAAGEVTALNQPGGNITYGYNLAGQRTRMTEVGLGDTTYAYDAFGRMTSMTNRFGETTQIGYDSRGLPWSKVFSNGVLEQTAYDARGRMVGVVTWNSAGVIQMRVRQYIYNAANRITHAIEDGITTQYGYDAVGRLLTETQPGYSASYTYDGQGNRATRTVNGLTENYYYDSGDKLTSVVWNGGQKTYSYDAAGRTTQIVGPSGTKNFAYDHASRLTSINGAGVSESYSYNGVGTRVARTAGSSTTNFLRDGVGVTAPVVRDTGATYTPGISERRSGVTTYHHHGLKSIENQSNVAQTMTGSRNYDAFGNVISSSGSWQGAFGYAGGFGYQEDASGYKLLGHRYYDSSTGRFLTRDPIKDGRNWYGYGAGEANPVTGGDPSGLEYHDPVQIQVDPGFGGTVIAFGDFPGRIDPHTGKWRPWEDSDGWRQTVVKPGQETHPLMDVDMILIIDSSGNAQLVWIPGKFKGQGSSVYRVDKSGAVTAVNGGYAPISVENMEKSVWLSHQLAAIIAFYHVLNMWNDWIGQAFATGFPKQYEPRPMGVLRR